MIKGNNSTIRFFAQVPQRVNLLRVLGHGNKIESDDGRTAIGSILDTGRNNRFSYLQIDRVRESDLSKFDDLCYIEGIDDD